MKLIRLESDTELLTSQFTNYLQEPLVLQKRASVGLKTLSCQFAKPPYVVDSSNDTFSYKTSDSDDFHVIVLDHGSFTASSLCNIIQNRMNNVLDGSDSANSDYAFKWQVELVPSITSDEKLTLSFSREDPITLDDTNTDLLNMDYDNSGTVPFFKKDVADDPDISVLNSFLVSKSLLCNGGFNVSAVLGSAVGGDTIDECNWYMTVEPVTDMSGNQDFGEVLDRSIALFGVYEGFYCYKKDGILQYPMTDIPEVDDAVSISNNNGIIKYASDAIEYVGDGLNALFPNFGSLDCQVCFYIQKDFDLMAFSNISVTVDPFETFDAGKYTRISNADLEHVRHNANLEAVAESNVTMLLLQGSRRLLGFDDLTYSINALSGEFEPKDNLETNIFNTDMVIEILELPCESYDQTYKQKRPIISVIAKGDLEHSTSDIGSYDLSVTEAYPIFINLYNLQHTLNYSSLTVKVTSQGVLLPLSGKMSCSLLFQDEFDK